MLVLEVRNGFKAVNSGNVGMGWTKFLFELSIDIFPINKTVRLWVLFFPSEYSSYYNFTYFTIIFTIIT
jgi:hypothetical protein